MLAVRPVHDEQVRPVDDGQILVRHGRRHGWMIAPTNLRHPQRAPGFAVDRVHNRLIGDRVQCNLRNFSDLEHRIQARALTHLESEEHAKALSVIHEGIVEVETILRDQGDPQVMETCTELTFLRDWEQEVEESRPRTEREQLSVDLEAAVEDEKFELAASLRDKLKEMDVGPGLSGPL